MATTQPRVRAGTIPTPAARISRPRWSAHTVLLFALGSAGVISALVLLLVHQSIWRELRVLIAALSAFIFVFLFVLLYRGIRLERNERWTLGWVHPRSLADHIPSVDLGTFSEAGAHQGLAGFLLGLLLDLLVSLLLVAVIVIVLWLGINVAIAAIAVLWFPLIYLFRRSVRHIVTRGRDCRGHVLRATGWAAVYTVVNAAWLYAILIIGQRAASYLGATGHDV